MAARAVQLVKLGAQLRDMARTYDCAIVVSNQVADRFAPASPPAAAAAATVMRSPMPSLSPPSSSSQQQHLSPAGTLAGGGSIDAVLMGLASSPTEPTANPPAATPAVAPSSTSANLLTLDHQMNFFTGWSAAAAAPPSEDHEQRQRQRQNLKTPSLGLVWANQIACRIALVKSRAYGSANDTTDTPVRGGRSGGEGKVGAVEVQSAASRAEWTPRRWRRWMKVVFAPWVEGVGEGKGVEFEIYGGGIRAVV